MRGSDPHRALAEFARPYRELPRPEFLKRVTWPVLLGAGVSADASADTGLGVRTLADQLIDHRERPEATLVYEVKKRHGSNPFMNMVTVGRATNNDIVLPTPNVSKLHAYLRQAGAEWSISDAGSTNGTWVDGKQVDRGGAPLRSRARVRLGKHVDLELLLPPELYDLLDSISRGGR
jgi:hypothetical protein